jgi:hypothetical protein
MACLAHHERESQVRLDCDVCVLMDVPNRHSLDLLAKHGWEGYGMKLCLCRRRRRVDIGKSARVSQPQVKHGGRTVEIPEKATGACHQ